LKNILSSNNTGATAADALVIGYRTILVDDCCRGVDLEDIERTKRNVISNHGVIVNSSQVSISKLL
jgi:nicotinamidase-related amidase